MGCMMDISIVGQADISTILPPSLLWENPLVETREKLRQRLAERIAERDTSMHRLSKAIGANAGYVRDLLDPEKSSMPSADRLQALARELDTTTDWLLGKAENPAQPISEVSFHDMRPQWRGESRSDKIPVYASGYCDDLEVEADGELHHIEQSLFEPGNVVQMIQRPPALWAAREAYAIYFHGSSMEDRFYQGEIGIVNPQRPPGPGDFVVVQLNDGQSAEVIHVLVKRLIRQTANFVELQQLNPRLTFRIDRKRVARMHLILSPTSLFA